jgi:hypothetical protein
VTTPCRWALRLKFPNNQLASQAHLVGSPGDEFMTFAAAVSVFLSARDRETNFIMKKVKIVFCPHCGGQIEPLPSPRGGEAPARTGLIERLTSIADDFSNESSDEKTADDFAAALSRNTFRR